MAYKIEYTSMSAKNIVTPTSRYSNSKILYYSDEKILTFETYKKPRFSISKDDQVAVIPASMQYRPDLVSKDKYGTVDFWWKIMEVNNIKDIFDFVTGKTIILPRDIYA